ncbi:MAG: hypothetical protein U1F37_20410 [Alphaproteobacteria bacterium]
MAERGRTAALLNVAPTSPWALGALAARTTRRYSGAVEALHALTHPAVLAAIFAAVIPFCQGIVMRLGVAATMPLALTLVARFSGAPATAR